MRVGSKLWQSKQPDSGSDLPSQIKRKRDGGGATSRAKYWLFTLNNYEGLLQCNEWPVVPEYCIYQEEVGDSGTPHLQGYVCFFERMRLPGVRSCVPGAHWEVRRGTHEEAKAYCSKEDTRVGGPYVFGADDKVPRTQGQRNDLIEVKESIDAGEGLRPLYNAHFEPMIRYQRSLMNYRELVAVRRMWPMEIIIYCGGTGTGKTRAAADKYPLAFWLPPAKKSGTYWDGYDGEETVIIDEMYGNRFAASFLLQLTDRYPLRVPVHGGSVQFTSKRIVFTSNKRPEEWYNEGVGMWKAFERRITIIHDTFAPPEPTILVGSRKAYIEMLPDREAEGDRIPTDKGKEELYPEINK